eukprot:CAMPEP_0196758590 /NCGR_PEP_ID=MMETSP1091-20130531/104263_1 /TAXON_ID=302021 /ORGANISM="Rhodomonas sp., Strain CCMP768" /LENGTH=216 /DNA_ID=CAMNT_0042107419 /DNA_START=1467 /DNA_END=2117 /DNA_ORIENTATION=-
MTKSLDFWIKSSLALSIFIYPSISQAISDTKPETNVYDESGVLTKSSINFLEKTMQKLKETNGTNVYFISVRNLPYGIEPEQYAEELFQKWNLGEKDILVVLANKIARAGIFSGSGVPNLTKEKAKSISEETYPFKAKEEQYSSAALDVSNRLVSILSNKGDPGPPALVREGNSSNFKSAKATEQQRSKYVAIIIILLVVAFVVPMVQFFYYVKDE